MDLGPLFEQAAKIGNSTITILLLIAGLFVYLAREIAKLRTDFLKQTRDTSLERRTAIIDIFKTLDELKKHDVQDFELRAIKEQLLKDLKIKIGNDQIATLAPAASGQSTIQDSANKILTKSFIPDDLENWSLRYRIRNFLGGLFIFSVGTVWATGWGFGTAAFGSTILSQLMQDIIDSASGGFIGRVIFKAIAFIIVLLLYFGLSIIPVISVAGIALKGMFVMIISTFPKLGKSRFIRRIDGIAQKFKAK